MKWKCGKNMVLYQILKVG